jgi:hypothetical protein
LTIFQQSGIEKMLLFGVQLTYPGAPRQSRSCLCNPNENQGDFIIVCVEDVFNPPAAGFEDV